MWIILAFTAQCIRRTERFWYSLGLSGGHGMIPGAWIGGGSKLTLFLGSIAMGVVSLAMKKILEYLRDFGLQGPFSLIVAG